MNERIIPGAIVIAFFLVLLVLMYLGWRARRRRQSALPRAAEVPAAVGEPVLVSDVFYVATTVADEPLNRIAVSGLGFRARAVVRVHAGGVALDIPGEPVAWIPRERIRGVDRATWTIDRVVEKGGLTRLAWALGDTEVDSYLRVTEPADPRPLVDAIQNCIEGHTGATTVAGNEEK